MQGFNMGRYYPPPEDNSAPTFNTSHPLGQRARKLRSEGILTVRFEMPFAIWCNTCPKPTIIGQGVRFNAEKKKVGNYHSTPIWQFRMKHTACGGWIGIQTDPKAAEYVVVEGAKRRDYGDERREDEIGFIDPAERDRKREDAMAGLEGKKDEEKIKKESGQRIRELMSESDKWWSDPYEASRFVRKGFRKERKERAREAQRADDLKDRLGLSLDLLPETDVDKRHAQLVEFGPVPHASGNALSKPLFRNKRTLSPAQASSSARSDRSKTSATLHEALRQNTLMAADPFGKTHTTDLTALSTKPTLAGLKKVAHTKPVDVEAAPSSSTPLVAYDSD